MKYFNAFPKRPTNAEDSSCSGFFIAVRESEDNEFTDDVIDGLLRKFDLKDRPDIKNMCFEEYPTGEKVEKEKRTELLEIKEQFVYVFFTSDSKENILSRIQKDLKDGKIFNTAGDELSRDFELIKKKLSVEPVKYSLPSVAPCKKSNDVRNAIENLKENNIDLLKGETKGGWCGNTIKGILETISKKAGIREGSEAYRKLAYDRQQNIDELAEYIDSVLNGPIEGDCFFLNAFTSVIGKLDKASQDMLAFMLLKAFCDGEGAQMNKAVELYHKNKELLQFLENEMLILERTIDELRPLAEECPELKNTISKLEKDYEAMKRTLEIFMRDHTGHDIPFAEAMIILCEEYKKRNLRMPADRTLRRWIKDQRDPTGYFRGLKMSESDWRICCGNIANAKVQNKSRGKISERMRKRDAINKKSWT